MENSAFEYEHPPVSLDELLTEMQAAGITPYPEEQIRDTLTRLQDTVLTSDGLYGLRLSRFGSRKNNTY